jgi:hypothetical protein
MSYEPSPSATLDSCGGSIELLLEFFHRSEVTLDGFFQGTIGKIAAVSIGGRKILPKQRMVDVA